jgi:protein-disulfide isomerase
MLDEKILPVYGGKVAFLHKDFPLAKHPWARKAAIAGRFFLATSSSLAVEYRRAVMREQERIGPGGFDGWLGRFAQEHGADPARALASLDDPKLAAAVEDDYQEGVARGIAHTPTVFVNGRPFIETIPYKDLAGAIDKELARR